LDSGLLADWTRAAAVTSLSGQEMIIQVPEAVGAGDCHRLMRMYNRHVHLTEARDQTGFPVVYWPQFRDAPDAAEIVPRLVEECLRNICSQLRSAEPLYPETLILAVMGAGGHHSRHADNCRQDEQGDWVANHTPHRDVSAICYLNDEFDGGEIFFARAQLTVRPRRGLILAFPSDADHVHEVLPVRSGVRYTMPIWFTKQQRFALPMAGL
jgi:predicted 2-oxoglutarate/Fe(II)-dependent dioxygenase YbiX